MHKILENFPNFSQNKIFHLLNRKFLWRAVRRGGAGTGSLSPAEEHIWIYKVVLGWQKSDRDGSVGKWLALYVQGFGVRFPARTAIFFIFFIIDLLLISTRYMDPAAATVPLST